MPVEAKLALNGCRDVASDAPNYGVRIRAAEVIAALSLATDLAIGVPLAHGLQSTLIAMRLGQQLALASALARPRIHDQGDGRHVVIRATARLAS